jgi:osmotically inducible protein OsmC
MALSNELSSRGTPPETLEVGATCTFVPGEGITTMVLDVVATMPGVSEEQFRTGLDAAELSCPVSGALKGNVAITVNGRLA